MKGGDHQGRAALVLEAPAALTVEDIDAPAALTVEETASPAALTVEETATVAGMTAGQVLLYTQENKTER